MMTDTAHPISKLDLLSQATDIVTAYVSNNAISATDLPDLLKTVHTKLEELANEAAQPETLEPAVPIKKSVTDHHIICLEDGAKRTKARGCCSGLQRRMNPRPTLECPSFCC